MINYSYVNYPNNTTIDTHSTYNYNHIINPSFQQAKVKNTHPVTLS